ncbi:UDP-N-acetylmuramate dehydrogenase [Albibacterium bauzanense]|uniref:UDP-N-acetylenolpyruvoylglucosamine reductase n=1 Tax=Albibacterium bauzanense TaxID=653929 RepID=A0A4R1M7F3_9SPHI|nr:UDP-N-acetylmuramate dehydrogenase [Albibacterium bauzanense]TCK85769.1 UDP-N-acetylmuramate dehydrogenase [Albibacterium bauzanense]
MSVVFQENKSLKELNTFGVQAVAKYFIEVNSEQELSDIFEDERVNDLPLLVLGGGSNMLFTQNFNGLVLHIKIGGIEIREQGSDRYITAGGGVVWNDLVQYCVNHGYAGIENLSLIPGTVGAAPVQNIGAYGVELMDVFESCRAYDRILKTWVEFDKAACKFSYRDSIFKREGKDRYIITSVTLKLSTVPHLVLDYGAVLAELQSRKISNPSIKDVSKVISEIRVSKLPDPLTIGNSGSFFKNPIIESVDFQKLQSIFMDIVHYPIQSDKVKLAAGWLIEQCGWKGVKVGNTGTWKNQALVLVNYGNANGLEVYEFSEAIIESVYKKFGVRIEREVNII